MQHVIIFVPISAETEQNVVEFSQSNTRKEVMLSNTKIFLKALGRKCVSGLELS